MDIIRNILRDVYLLVVNLHLLVYIKKINKEDQQFINELVPTFRSHLPKQPWYKRLVTLIVPRTWPIKRTPEVLEHSTMYRNNAEYKFVFVNGILTSRNKMAMYMASVSHVFKTDVTGIYNPSNGIIMDLLETIFSRTFDASEKVVVKTEEQVLKILTDNPQKQIILIGHSQGGLIVTEVVKRLASKYPNSEMFNRLQAYTFGSASDDLRLEHLSIKPHVEHFINDKDFVASIGAKANSHMLYGESKIADRTGHDFHIHYLPGILSKQYGHTRLIDVYKNRLVSNISTTRRYLVEENIDDPDR